MEMIFLPLHFMALAFVAWNVYHADHMGFMWMKGETPLLNKDEVSKYHRNTWIGLITMIVSGFFLFFPAKDYYLTRPQFLIKMGFVLALFVNSFAIGNLSKLPTMKTYASLSTKEKIPLMISGAVSAISWLGAFTMAFFLEQE